MKMHGMLAAVVVAAVCSAALGQAPGAGAGASGSKTTVSQGTATQTSAADRPSREDVLKMFAAMHVQKQMEQMMTLMNAQVKRQLQASMKQGTALSAEDQAKLDASSGGAMNVYPVSEMMDDMVPIYQRHMSKTDVEAIVAFYGTPAGEHLLEESPKMMKETMATIMPKANARVQAYVEKTMKDLGSGSGAGAGASSSGTGLSGTGSSTVPPK